VTTKNMKGLFSLYLCHNGVYIYDFVPHQINAVFWFVLTENF
jgi:hypothetical protein